MVVYGHQIVVMKDINAITYFSSVLFQLYWKCMFRKKGISCHSALPISFTHFGWSDNLKCIRNFLCAQLGCTAQFAPSVILRIRPYCLCEIMLFLQRILGYIHSFIVCVSIIC